MAVSFTPRELQIARLLAQGKRKDAIGQELGIDANTVRGYMGRIYKKVGISAYQKQCAFIKWFHDHEREYR